MSPYWLYTRKLYLQEEGVDTSGAAWEVLTVWVTRGLMLVGVKTILLFHITRKYQVIRAVCNERVL